MGIVNRILAWSYSRWRDYEQCPLKAKYKHVDRLKEPANEAMERGTAIHLLAEHYAGGKLKRLPKELEKFKKEFAALKKMKPKLEEQWAFNSKWERVDWFSKEAWLRVKMDAAYMLNKFTAELIDHKTGKFKEGEYEEQLELYALAAFIIFPEAKQVVCRLWFLDSGDEVLRAFDRADWPNLEKTWQKRIKPMMMDKKFAPKPGNYCRWCAFSQSKGGKCKF